MKIVIAGGTGFLGRALSDALLEEGHDITVLTRARSGRGTGVAREPATSTDGPARLTWIPDGTAGPWASVIDGAGVVVNLAGDSIAAGRWTAARKQSISDSRLLATRSLVAAMAAARNPPATFLSASAQGYYGDRGDDALAEDAPRGSGFLAGVCDAWEKEARGVSSGTRLVLLRTGIVLDARDGALPRMLTPFRLFAGGPVGSGRQYMPWVHVDDWVGITRWAIEKRELQGPVNICAPEAVRNRDFSNAIGRALRRPSWLPVPGLALRTALGEMGEALLLTSTRMVPARALSLGYAFRFASLDAALSDLL